MGLKGREERDLDRVGREYRTAGRERGKIEDLLKMRILDGRAAGYSYDTTKENVLVLSCPMATSCARRGSAAGKTSLPTIIVKKNPWGYLSLKLSSSGSATDVVATKGMRERSKGVRGADRNAGNDPTDSFSDESFDT